MSRIHTALDGIVFARDYTLSLLDTVPPADWFRMPPGAVSHVGWQVGHLASAQYRLTLVRIRGVRPEDASFLPDDFIKTFGATSAIDPSPTAYPSPAAIREVFDRVHQQVLAEVQTLDDAVLDASLETPHWVCRTKFDCLVWCGRHELIHAGQIGLLRRHLGMSPVW